MIKRVLILFFFIMTLTCSVHALCVKKSDVNLRNGPGTNYKIIGLAFKHTPFIKIERKGKWIRVRNVDGKKFWIHRNLVTTKSQCAVVKANEANVRTGPGTRYKQIDYSPSIKYETFKVIGRKGSWVKVEDEFGSKGWIYRKLLWIQ